VNRESESSVLFREVQKFREQQLSSWIVPVLFLVSLAVFLYCLWTRVVPEKPCDTLTVGSGAVALVLCLSMPFIYVMKLITEVRLDGLFIRFVPLHLSFKRIPLETFAGYEVVTYRPILDYGGWGIRYGWKGKAYNVSGNRGVRFKSLRGRDLLIGSQRPEELASAIAIIFARG
jgi:hypothetical protein